MWPRSTVLHGSTWKADVIRLPSTDPSKQGKHAYMSGRLISMQSFQHGDQGIAEEVIAVVQIWRHSQSVEAWLALTHGAAYGPGPSKDHCINDRCNSHLSCVIMAAAASSLASRAVLSPAASVQPYRFRMRQPGSMACSLASRPHDRGSPLDTSCRSINLLAWPAGRQVLFWK